ncbi:hypothetical protein [Pseudoalteromonas piscicida]|uniref:hypothetical protein n=1 Tax=Pseudoalteromonas piscicida TaxID=43662 RepID=UPI0005FA0CC7|nr:hypothetical protein [Pseudoalteromonas piscicida]KJZ03261.1 hypothetical protein TW73_08915 [Pseudoalteromonas piscicida]
MDLSLGLTIVVICVAVSIFTVVSTVRKIKVRPEYANEAIDNIAQRVYVKKDRNISETERAAKLICLDIEAEILLRKAHQEHTAIRDKK